MNANRRTYTVTDNAGRPEAMATTHPLIVRLAGLLGIHAARILFVAAEDVTDDCPRCSGTGHIPIYNFNGGQCYACMDDPGIANYATNYTVEYTATTEEAGAYRDRMENRPTGVSFLASLLASVGQPITTTTAVLR